MRLEEELRPDSPASCTAPGAGQLAGECLLSLSFLPPPLTAHGQEEAADAADAPSRWSGRSCPQKGGCNRRDPFLKTRPPKLRQ